MVQSRGSNPQAAYPQRPLDCSSCSSPLQRDTTKLPPRRVELLRERRGSDHPPPRGSPRENFGRRFRDSPDRARDDRRHSSSHGHPPRGSHRERDLRAGLSRQSTTDGRPRPRSDQPQEGAVLARSWRRTSPARRSSPPPRREPTADGPRPAPAIVTFPPRPVATAAPPGVGGGSSRTGGSLDSDGDTDDDVRPEASGGPITRCKRRAIAARKRATLIDFRAQYYTLAERISRFEADLLRVRQRETIKDGDLQRLRGERNALAERCRRRDAVVHVLRTSLDALGNAISAPGPVDHAAVARIITRAVTLSGFSAATEVEAAPAPPAVVEASPPGSPRFEPRSPDHDPPGWVEQPDPPSRSSSSGSFFTLLQNL